MSPVWINITIRQQTSVECECYQKDPIGFLPNGMCMMKPIAGQGAHCLMSKTISTTHNSQDLSVL